MRPLRPLLLLPLALGIAAQAREPAASPARIAPPSRIPAPIRPESSPLGTPVAAAGIPKVVRHAVVADAARRFEVPESAVVLARAEQVTWGDGSLGCPVPGRVYAQMLVPGYRVTAATASGQMLYHTDSLGNVVTCGKPASAPAASREGRR
ncbi:MAG TPA: hypothetical protein VM146_01550 [Steroidobacteraceae bacterium]|nr:hypothetical protein [Steroidobacteraceae bacterium]